MTNGWVLMRQSWPELDTYALSLWVHHIHSYRHFNTHTHTHTHTYTNSPTHALLHKLQHKLLLTLLHTLQHTVLHTHSYLHSHTHTLLHTHTHTVTKTERRRLQAFSYDVFIDRSSYRPADQQHSKTTLRMTNTCSHKYTLLLDSLGTLVRDSR